VIWLYKRSGSEKGLDNYFYLPEVKAALFKAALFKAALFKPVKPVRRLSFIDESRALRMKMKRLFLAAEAERA
jgi:hypothetical protein